MSKLLDLWNSDRTLFEGMSVDQVIILAGGDLRDGSDTSERLREFLREVSLNLLVQYSDDCLNRKFENSGLVLQDIVNQIGSRLDFDVTHGRYRGKQGQQLGQDGVWANHDGHTIVVEVKTGVDIHQITLGDLDNYRQSLAKNGELQLEKSSVLIVVGREDTKNLEGQIRGLNFDQSMRVVSVKALLRILELKGGVEDSSFFRQVHSVLLPKNFIKLDSIIDIVLDAVEDSKQEMELQEMAAESDAEEDEDQKKRASTRVNFHDECISRAEKCLGGISLAKQSNNLFKTAEGTTAVVSAISKFYEKDNCYGLTFSEVQHELLSQEKEAYVAFGCGDANTLFLIPFPEFRQQLNNLGKGVRKTASGEHRPFWHVKIRESNGSYLMPGVKGNADFDISKFKI